MRRLSVIVFCLSAVMLTSVRAAPAGDEDAIFFCIMQMQNQASVVIRNRLRDINMSFRLTEVSQNPVAYVSNKIAAIASKAIPKDPPYSQDQLLGWPNGQDTSDIPSRFLRAYHALVFEKLKTLFIKLQLLIDDTIDSGMYQSVEMGLKELWRALENHYNLEARYRGPKHHGNPIQLKLPFFDATRPGKISEELTNRRPMKFDGSKLHGDIQRITRLRQACRNDIELLLSTPNPSRALQRTACMWIL
ncbi:hypothetical protein SeLEV6574_g06977, partial [Synchytrium endobioticum]